jgi:xylulokinase
MALYIGIDSGTQSTKAVVLDMDSGRVLATARATYGLISGLPPGHMEQHPADWVRALDSVLKQVTRSIDRSRVRGIGISGQQHGFVPLDAKGRVIRPAKLWCDTSTSEECAILTRKLGGPSAVIRETGLPFLPGYTAPKILWLKRREPASFRRLRHVLLPHDYLNYHLTGCVTMEHGDASGTALLDVRRRRWSVRAMDAIDSSLHEAMPELRDSRKAAGRITPEIARRYGLPEGVLVSSGGGDNMMGAIGTGNVQTGVVTASLGTSGTIYACSPKPIVDPRGEIAAFCSSTGEWLPLLCTMNVTQVTEQVRALFGMDHRALDAAVKKVPAGSGGLLLLPYFNGERTPNLPNGRGVLYGLTLANASPGHIARAAMEGVTLGLNYGLGRLAALGLRPREIRLTGGGAKSAAWRQLAADVFGVPVVKMVEDEGAALGGALQAAWTDSIESGVRESLAQLCSRAVRVDEKSRREPNRDSHRSYRGVQERYEALGARLRPMFA